MKLNIGLSKKVGQPDYGSLGASCHVEVELDSTLLQQDLDAFQQRVRGAYIACHQAVEDELARHRQQTRTATRPPVEAPVSHSATSGNGSGPAANNRITSQNGNGTNGHVASEKQLSYINQLARQIRGLGVRRVDEVSLRMFNKPSGAISSLEASSLIDTLKAVKEGQIAVDDLLGAGAAS